MKKSVGEKRKFEGSARPNKKSSLVQGSLEEEEPKQSGVTSARRNTLGNVTKKSVVLNVESLGTMPTSARTIRRSVMGATRKGTSRGTARRRKK